MAFILFVMPSHADGTSAAWPDEAIENFKSPLTTEAKYPLLIGLGIAGGLVLLKEQIVDPFQKKTSEDKPLGDSSRYGDLAGQGLPNALYVTGMLSYGLMSSSYEFMSHASSMLQASVYATFFTTAIKVTVREPRPYDPETKNSFPSGHTTAAFVFASYVGCRHSIPWGIAAYSLATFVGYSRINDNAHYLQDVIAGAAIGGSYGLGICLRENETQKMDTENIKTFWAVAPVEGGAVGLFTIRY